MYWYIQQVRGQRISIANATNVTAGEQWLPAVVEISAGAFIAGSDNAERETAYRLDEAAYGSPVTREQHWYDAERSRQLVQTAAYAITATPITNRQYAAFIAATGHRLPDVDPAHLNSHDAGPFDTTPVGRYSAGASPYGLLDAAGQVFEWTATAADPGRALVKGGSWDDKGCGVCRPAARHGRPVEIKHILIGLRLVQEVGQHDPIASAPPTRSRQQ